MPHLGRKTYHLILCAVTLATVLALFANTPLWQTAIGPMHSVEKTDYPFQDMGARLRMAERTAAGYDINHDFSNNKPLYTVHALKLLGLDTSDKIPLSLFFIGLFMLWNLTLVRPKRTFELLIALGVLLSPPCLMLIERANDDIIIYSLICVVPLFLKIDSTVARVGAWATISALVPMKYYPAAAYALLLHREHSFKRLACFVLLSLLFLGAFLFFIWEELTVIHDRIPGASIFCSFGGRLLFDSMMLNGAVGRLLMFLGLGTLLCWAGFILFKARPRDVGINKASERYFLLGSAILTFCFFMNGNWDYRMAFLIPTIPLAFEWLSSGLQRERSLAATYLIAVLLTLWPEYIYYASVHQGDGQWVHQRALHLAAIVCKHAASWVMIGSQMLIAAYVLQPDVRQTFEELRHSLKPKIKGNS
jgi:hypothetical protein